MNSPRLTSLQLLILDALAVGAAFNSVGWLRGVVVPGEWVVLPLLVPLLVIVVSLYLIDGYRPRTDMLSLDYASEHVITLLLSMLGMILLTFVIIPVGYSLQQSRAVVLISFLALVPVTLSYRRWLYLARQRYRRQQSLIFMGSAENCRDFARECEKQNFTLPVIYTTLDAISAPDAVSPEPIPFTDVLEKLDRRELIVEAIIIRESSQEFPPDISQRLMQLYFEGVPTYTLELFHQVYWRKIPLYRLNQAWLFQEGFKIAREPIYERFKRLSDIILASAGLLLSSPVILIAAFAIWLEDRGQVFFFQKRIGRNRRLFSIVKLRTMRLQATLGAKYTGVSDDRITRTGRFLRLTRIDEFPQLWNVLRGEMSLIGPRAEWDLLVQEYERQIGCYHFRHLVKPGITGWAQVNYPYGANLEDTVRKLEYDLYYIRHFSFLLDAAIVLKTIHVIMFGKGR
ncbi:MAG TPA: exopolysaccharide biosynthesis polyprenyl glycosylphosphotransferase [Opitutaceae bacterium]|nr:exopolysaccharide biosynthesis polyprenyl glycosylphosphotransferase [Opitutaceae bacterium]HRJ45734.1 exopolysaccharide biosynthesis polyprenyl glycosylphosphotransferase [Opitutaceae bacterium]